MFLLARAKELIKQYTVPCKCGSLDAASVMDGLTLIQFFDKIQDKRIKSKRAKNIPQWRKDIQEALNEARKNEWVTDKEAESILTEIKKEPTVFFTWHTS